MKRLNGFGDRSSYRGCFLSIGNFDGVHRGHLAILARLVERARQHRAPAVVMTFEPHPLSLLKPDAEPPRLTTPRRRAELLEHAGVDVVLEYPTSWDLLRLSPRDFFDQMIVEELSAQGLVEGPNFFFGQGRAGNIDVLNELCRSAGLSLDVVEPTRIGAAIVSSTLIRETLAAGDVRGATQLLGRPYDISGVVASGAGRGRTLGYPTANLQQVETLLPGDGVYAAWCVVSGDRIPAAVSIGPNPTFAEGERKVEAHLLGFTENLYGVQINLQFVDRLRSLRAFESAAQLQQQLEQDVASVQGVLDAGP